jgi:4-hydroxy-3-methylbut-2-enyl diphosphate reductase
VPTFHIAEPACLVSPFEIRHKPVGGKDERVSKGWLPGAGRVVVGLTSGASTPDNLVETVIRRLDAFANNAESG